MTYEYIWIKNRKYYRYKEYKKWEEARNTAKRFKKKNKCRYFIMKIEKQGFLEIIPEIRYVLYLDRVMKLW